MAGFVARLEEINALADRSPGFVWRLQTEHGDATAIRVFDDPTLIVNLSVWQSLAALRDFVYRSDHRELLRDRNHWFERSARPHMVLWRVPAGHLPDLEEACARLEQLRAEGPTARAFTFATALRWAPEWA